MIPTTQYDKAITSGNSEVASANIALTPEMFELLSAGIYEDRPLAIVRELACNARDAQREAGNGDKPMEIHVPNAFEPFFSTRDFGTGLTQEQIFEIYLTYGASTKRDSNEFVGMFGIGSKSPLAYTDSFLVTSYIDGMEVQYNIYKDNGIPKVAKMFEKPTEEPNGLKVTVAIRQGDFSVFHDRVATFFKLFDQDVVIEGGNINTDVDIVEQNDLYWIVNGYDWGAYALMGGVPYRLANSVQEDLKKDLKVNTILLPFELGELNIASSRENLSFNEGDATDTAIKDRVQEIKDVFQQKLMDAVSSCKTIHDVVKELQENYGMTHSSYYSRTTNMDHMEWGGKTIKEWRNELVEDGNRMRFFQSGEDKKFHGTDLGIFRNSFPIKVYLFKADRKTSNVKAARKFSKSKHWNEWVFFDLDEATIKKLKTVHGADKFEEVSCEAVYDGLFPKEESSTEKRVKVSGVFCRSDNQSNYGISTREVTEVDGTEDGYYVDMFRDKVTIGGHTVPRYDLNWLVDYGIVEKLWFIRGTASKKSRPKNLLKLEDHIDALLSEKVNKKVLKLAAQNNAYYEVRNVNFGEFPEIKESAILDKYPAMKFYNDSTEITKLRKRNSKVGADVLNILKHMDSLGNSSSDNFAGRIKKQVERIVTRYNKEVSQFYEDNPLLMACIDNAWVLRGKPAAKDQLIELILKNN